MRYRMKRLLAELLSAVILLSLLPAMAWAADFEGAASGNGTVDSPYQISTAEQLKKLSQYVNGGNNCQNTYFELTVDIDLGGGPDNQWTPIGKDDAQFKGSFDGGGHTISGLYIDSYAYDVGLFGYIDNQGTVKNLGVSGSIKASSSNSEVGGIAGTNYGTITDCHSACEIEGGGRTGGIVGHNGNGTVSDCYNTGSISGAEHAGGIVGKNAQSATVSGCYNVGSVNGSRYAGGIAGSNVNQIENCYNVGAVTGAGTFGGIAGTNEQKASITKCYYLDDMANGVGSDDSGTAGVESKSEDDFKSLATELDADKWTDDPFLGRPVLQGNQEPWPISGEGTDEHPFEIPDKETLEKVRNYVNAGNNCKDMYFRLTENINLESQEWTPIGDISNPFQGTFDGDGHTISGLNINAEYQNNQGLFGNVGSGGTVRNLSVSGSVTGNSHVGGVVGNNDGGTVENCASSCMVTGNYFVGGVVGSGGAAGCCNTGKVSGTIYVGGVAGSGDVTNCYNSGAVSGSESVGGVVGTSNTEVTNCYNTGEVTGASSTGGVAGAAYGAVTNCYNTGAVTGTSSTGGVAGAAYGAVTNCYYLDTTQADKKATPKTANQFASGEVAYLLQKDQGSQVWGQTVGNGYPELTGNAEKKVFKITGEVEGQADVVWYSNSKATLPTTEPTKAGFTFAGWSTQAARTEADFVKDFTVSDDMTVYAVFVDKRVDGTGTLTMKDYTCGDTSVMPEAKSDTNTGAVTITYKQKGADDNTYTSDKPTTAGEYTVKAVFPANQNYNELTLTADFKITHQFNAGWEQTEDGEYHLCACGVGLLLETKELSEVPEGLKQNLDVDTVEEIEQVLVEKVATGDHYVIYDVELEAWIGDEWKIITPESLPEEGVAITIPYPAGTNAKYPFTVVHMFTTTGDGHAPGDTEVLKATNETDGIHFTVKSLSPIIVGWKAGNLTVTVTDTGESADPARQWQFRVELSDTEITGQYGDMSFTDGVATFTMQSGQSLTARDLPEGVAYTVTEIKANQDGYTTTYTGDSGLISSEQDMVAAFINDKPAQAKPDKPSPDDSDDKPDTPTDNPPDTPTSNNPNDTPKTGDESHLALWLSLMILSLLGITVTVLTPIIGRKKPVSAHGKHMRK